MSWNDGFMEEADFFLIDKLRDWYAGEKFWIFEVIKWIKDVLFF